MGGRAAAPEVTEADHLRYLRPSRYAESDRLEAVLPRYDIVFATARMALEAAVVGCAVVVVDGRGFAGMLRSENLQADSFARDYHMTTEIAAMIAHSRAEAPDSRSSPSRAQSRALRPSAMPAAYRYM